jgi:hypothetical protein
MAKMFYSEEEAAQRLGVTPEELNKLVRKGDIREFRDAGKLNYKVDDVEAYAAKHPGGGAPPPASDSGVGDAASSASGEIILEPVEDSGIELSASGSDVLRLEDAAEDRLGDTGGTAAGTKAAEEKKKGSTSVPSVGVNVFDDDFDEAVDPLAQTAVTDVAGLGMEGTGSGSGILDLTRESDDTSLGAELLEEIYSGDEGSSGGEAVEVGDDTRAGLEVPDVAEGPTEDEVFESGEEAAGAPRHRAVTTTVEYGPDAVSTSLTALMVVAVVVMWFAGLAGAALVRGVVPSILQGVYENLLIFAGGALGVGAIAAGVTYFISKRSGQ